MLVPEHGEVPRDIGTSQCHLLFPCFDQVFWGLCDSRIHWACWEGGRESSGQGSEASHCCHHQQAGISGMANPYQRLRSSAQSSPAPRRQRVKQQRSLGTMAASQDIFWLREESPGVSSLKSYTSQCLIGAFAYDITALMSSLLCVTLHASHLLALCTPWPQGQLLYSPFPVLHRPSAKGGCR